METVKTEVVVSIKDAITSPKGGVLLIYNDGSTKYIASGEYHSKYACKVSAIDIERHNKKVHKKFLTYYPHCNHYKFEFERKRLKKRRDTQILLKYILPCIFKKLKLRMPSFSQLQLPEKFENKFAVEV